MQKWIYSCIAMMLFFTARLHAQDVAYADKVAKYVAQYKHLAIAEQQRSGVPAAVTLGQGILETEAGCSELVTGANNHFGIKCKKEWTGETFSHTDDAPNECFRKYKCADDSYKDHSDYLKNSPRYASLFLLSKTDYPAWAVGLRKCGYATNPRYAQQLIKIIEDFKLQEYTYAAMNGDLISQAEKKEILDNDSTDADEEDPAANFNKIKADADKAREVVMNPATTPVKSPSDKGEAIEVNGLKAIYGYKGDMLLQYAVKYKMRYEHLLEINDLPDAPLSSNMYIYLEKKNTKGAHDMHIVKPGESLIQIAQYEGIQLRRLMVLNRLNIGEVPQIGTVLQLRQFADSKPPIVSANTLFANRESNIKVKNSDDFVPTNRTTPVTEDKQDIVTQPNAVITKTPEAVVTTPVADENRPQVVTAPASNPETIKAAETEVAKPAMAEDKKEVVIMSGTATSTTDNPVAKTPETAPVAAVAPANEQKKVVEDKPVPVATQDNTPVQQNTQPPSDDLARLKAELDKVVYTNNDKHTTAPAPVAASIPEKTVTEKAETSKAAQPATTTKHSEKDYYTVKKGDTAFNIAKQNNITVHQLMEWNKLDFDEIKIGQRLRVKE